MKKLMDYIVKPMIGATAMFLIVFIIISGIDSVWEYFHLAEKSSSFVGYSQSCWQEGNVLHVVTAKGDTVRLDVSRLED